MLVCRILAVLMMASCATYGDPVISKRECLLRLTTHDKRIALEFDLTPDTHGYVGRIKECPGRPFGVDLSLSNFNDPANADLFRRAAVSSLVDHVPIEVKAEGKFVRRLRATILVVKKISLAQK